MSVYFMGNETRANRPSTQRVLMQFMTGKHGWRISFLEEDCRTALPLHLTFATPDKIIEMHDRWAETRTTESLSRLQGDIKMGRPGSVWLLLTAEQYAKLCRRT